MALICPHCNMYTLNTTKHQNNALHCATCHNDTPTNILPLFIITGASGSGKTTVIPPLRVRLPELVIFDKDILWGRTQPDLFNEVWLRIVYTIAQSGRHAVLCGTFMPWDIEKCADRGLIGTVHFLNLHCTDAVREQRLRARPAWRGSGGEAVVAEQRQFAHWLLEHAAGFYNPPMPTIDTTALSPTDVADAIGQWITTILDHKFTCASAPFAASA